MSLRDAAHRALADIQDWNELEALRESLREHMAEIHRLRSAVRQALEHLEKDARSFEDWLTMMQSARTSIRAALAEEKNENTVQSTGGVHARVSDGANRGVEAVTDCHEKEGDKLALPLDVPETNFGNMAQAVDCYGDGNVYRGQRSSDSKIPTLTINGMPAVEGPLSKAQRTGQESRQVEPVAYMSMCFSNGQTKPHSKTLFWPEQYTGRTAPVNAGAWGKEVVVPLYPAPPKRKPLTMPQIHELDWPNYVAFEDILKFTRALERAHDIGGEE